MSSRFLGYPEASRRLQHELTSGRVAHAYLVVGPPQVGKMVLAIELAMALNCQGPTPPCGACAQCQKTLAGNYPDVQVLGLLPDQKGERLRKLIGIDQVLALQHDAGLHPYWGQFRVFIIDDAQRLSSEAANCLLKTLEEPPAACVIILLATDETALPQTVVSRCRRVQLRPLSRGQVEEALLQQGTSPDESRLLARLSRGRLGWAISARSNAQLMTKRARSMEMLNRAMAEGLPSRFNLAEDMANLYYRDRESLDRTLQIWLGWARDLLLVKEGYGQGLCNVDEEEGLQRWSGRLSIEEIMTFIKAIMIAMEHLERNVNARLAMEALVLQAPGYGTSDVPGGAVYRRTTANA